jgi:hypothetical protein
MVEYEPGGAAQLHDHPLEESYTIMSGEVDAEADGERFTLSAGDVFWTAWAACTASGTRAAPGSVPRDAVTAAAANHSYRFKPRLDHLAERLGD